MLNACFNWFLNTALRLQGLRFRFQGLGIRFEGLGFRILAFLAQCIQPGLLQSTFGLLLLNGEFRWRISWTWETKIYPRFLWLSKLVRLFIQFIFLSIYVFVFII